MDEPPQELPPDESDPRLGPLVSSPSRYLVGYVLLFVGIVAFALLLGLTAWLLR
jgi:hypothetical protein